MTLAFAWRDGPAVRRFDGRHAFVVPGGDRPATYIIIDHEDDRGRLLLRDLYPDAKDAQAFLDRNGRLYAQAFRVENPGKLAREPQTPVAARWPDISLVGYDIDKTGLLAGAEGLLTALVACGCASGNRLDGVHARAGPVEAGWQHGLGGAGWAAGAGQRADAHLGGR